MNTNLTINQLITMSYKHFTADQRNELSALLRAEIKQKKIAELLLKDRTSIWRELKRNHSDNEKKHYNARQAKQLTKTRRIQANTRFKKLENNKWLRHYVVRKLKKCWSPEQIAGRLKRKYPNDKTKHIGKDSIYAFLYDKRKDLVKYLRCQKGKYRRRYGTRIREKQRELLKKKRIDKRPAIVATKQRIGDWEGDTMIGTDRKPAILTYAERKSGLLLADKLDRATAFAVKEKTIQIFNQEVPKDKKYTLTYDNGKEFSDYELIEKETGLVIYFATPYHSWERGCNENANGLLRQFFPKKIPLATITSEQIQKAVRLINSRPRKRHHYATPYEIFKSKT